ncbi:putative protein Pop3 [Capsicum annuum]|nr:putative protein Pop3 [Capsicum annuum]
MEGTKGGVVKHILLAKFKDEISPDKIDQLIKQYANLVNLIEPMKAFHWSAYAYSPQTSLCGIPLGYVVVIDVAAFGYHFLDGALTRDVMLVNRYFKNDC